MTIQVVSNEKPISPPPPSPSTAVETPAVVDIQAVGDAAESSKESPSSAPEAREAPEQKESSESETEETSISAHPEEEEERETKEEAQEKEPTPKKKGGFQRRIDKLNTRVADRERELEFWRQEALKQRSTEAPKPNQTSSLTPALDATPKPNPERYDTHAAYVEALTDWKLEQKLKEYNQKQAMDRLTQEQQSLVAAHSERVRAFSETTPDYQEVLEEVDHIPLSATLRTIVLTSDNGPQLAYELAKKPEELERISKLPPLAAAREIGKLEARIHSSSSSKSAAAERTEKKITQAPKPLTPIGSGGKGSVPKTIFDSSLSQKEYEAIRREQIKKRRQASS